MLSHKQQVVGDDAHQVHTNLSDPAKMFTTSFEYDTIRPSDQQTRTTVQRLLEDGYAILPNVLSAGEIGQIKAALDPHLQEKGRNHFEGAQTQRGAHTEQPLGPMHRSVACCVCSVRLAEQVTRVRPTGATPTCAASAGRIAHQEPSHHRLSSDQTSAR